MATPRNMPATPTIVEDSPNFTDEPQTASSNMRNNSSYHDLTESDPDLREKEEKKLSRTASAPAKLSKKGKEDKEEKPRNKSAPARQRTSLEDAFAPPPAPEEITSPPTLDSLFEPGSGALSEEEDPESFTPISQRSPTASPPSESAESPNEKKENPFKEYILSILKFLIAFFSSSTFAINADIGAGKTEKWGFPDFTPPENLAALTKTGFTGAWYLNAFALLSGVCSLLINIYQFYDFAPQLGESYKSHILPILKKIRHGRFLEATKKERTILVGILLATTAAIASGIVAWDTTKKSKEWYFHTLLGSLNVVSTLIMTFLTRSVSTKKLIDNTALFYSEDKRPALKLLKKLVQTQKKLQSMTPYPMDEATQAKVEIVSQEFAKYGIESPNYMAIGDAIYTAEHQVSTVCETAYFLCKTGIVSGLALINVAICWYIYTKKLESALDYLELAGIAKICWNITCVIGASPHPPLYYNATLEIPGNIKEAYSISRFKTLFAGLITLPTSFGLLNVCRDALKSSSFDPDSLIGMIVEFLAFMAASVVNGNSLLKVAILKNKIKGDEALLKQNPYHQVLQKIIREEPYPLLEDKHTTPAVVTDIKPFSNTKASFFRSSSQLPNQLKEPLLSAGENSTGHESSTWFGYIRSFCGARRQGRA